MFEPLLILAASTMPAERVRPESSAEASVRSVSIDFDCPAAANCASIERRSASLTSPISISASTKKRRPSSVGRRPADVCGA
jgi:hypothetical protein